MNEVALTAIVFGGLLILLGSSIWIGVGVGLIGMMALSAFTGYPVGYQMAQVSMGLTNSFVLVCLPGFILMGEILYRSGASKDLYESISPWVTRIPGQLLHSNVISCTIFAAMCGSSSATAATIGTAAVPELKKLGYQPGMVAGSLAGAGTLGLLIPPSIALICYGIITGNSVGQLYMAGFLPGFMLALMFMTFIAVFALIRPEIVPATAKLYTWKERLQGTVKIWPTLVLIFLVLGLIYLGVSTPTEAAMIGVTGAFLTTFLYKTFSFRVMKEAMLGAIRTSCMLLFIMMMAGILSSVVGYLRIPSGLAAAAVGAGLSPTSLFVLICILYLILGCFFDGLSMMLLTLPIVYPLLVTEIGFDPIWFGVVLTILIEVAQLTPPVGFNLYVIQHISGLPIGRVAKWSLPFSTILVIGVAILYLFPQIALFLPRTMIQR